ncbi:MAG: invasion associated locus B family protein, partial [Pseudomonadota bacterium]
WEVHCAVNDEKLCFMSQVANGQNGKPLVNVRIQKTPNLKTPKGDAVPAVIQIQAPLGVLLTAGLSLQIDSAKPGLAPYKFCTPQNCVVEEPIAPDLIDRMKKGSNAKMSVISAISGDKGEADVSLSGFTKAFNSL